MSGIVIGETTLGQLRNIALPMDHPPRWHAIPVGPAVIPHDVIPLRNVWEARPSSHAEQPAHGLVYFFPLLDSPSVSRFYQAVSSQEIHRNLAAFHSQFSQVLAVDAFGLERIPLAFHRPLVIGNEPLADLGDHRAQLFRFVSNRPVEPARNRIVLQSPRLGFGHWYSFMHEPPHATDHSQIDFVVVDWKKATVDAIIPTRRILIPLVAVGDIIEKRLRPIYDIAPSLGECSNHGHIVVPFAGIVDWTGTVEQVNTTPNRAVAPASRARHHE